MNIHQNLKNVRGGGSLFGIGGGNVLFASGGGTTEICNSQGTSDVTINNANMIGPWQGIVTVPGGSNSFTCADLQALGNLAPVYAPLGYPGSNF